MMAKERMNERNPSFFMAIQLNEVKWSYLSLADARFLTCQIKEKLSVGEMRHIWGWRWLSTGIRQHFRKPFSLLLSYTPYDLSDWLNVECSCGGTWFTEPESYSHLLVFTCTSKSKYPVRFDLISFFFVILFGLACSDSLLMYKWHGYTILWLETLTGSQLLIFIHQISLCWIYSPKVWGH